MTAARVFKQWNGLWVSALLVAACGVAAAQSVVLVPSATKYAGVGTNSRGYSSDAGPAATVELNLPAAVATDGSGNLIIADTGNNCVRRVGTTAQHTMTTVAGLATASGDTCNTANQSGSALSPSQSLLSPGGVAADASNNIFIADTGNNCVRELPAGTTGVATLQTVAGTCSQASGSATPSPAALATNRAGDLYILVRDTTRSVYQVLRHDAGSGPGTLCLIAGAPSSQVSNLCSNVTAAAPSLNAPSGLGTDTAGNLYIADTNNNCVRQFSSSTGAFAVAAGTCGSPASTVQAPTSVAVSYNGSLYITLGQNNQILRYNQATGTSIVVSGNANGVPGAYLASQDGAASTAIPLNNPQGITTNTTGNVLFVADSGNSVVRELQVSTVFPQANVGTPTAQQVLTYEITASSTLTVTPGTDYSVVPGSDTCSGPQTAAAPGAPPAYCKVGLVFTPSAPGNRFSPLTITDTSVTPNSVVATGLQGVGLGPIAQVLPGQAGVLTTNPGITVLDVAHDTTASYQLQSNGGASRVVRQPYGGGPSSSIGTGLLSSPASMAVDAAGNIYVADLTGSSSGGPAIHRFGKDGSYTQDFITGLNKPVAIRADGYGNLYIADKGAGTLLKVYATGGRGVLAGAGTVAATQSNQAVADGSLATSIKLVQPAGVAVGPDGTVYVSDQSNQYVYSIDPAGIFHYVAGNGTATTAVGSAQAATGQALSAPGALEVDAAGDLFIADQTGNAVYVRFAASDPTNNMRRLLGDATGTQANAGDGGPANAAAVASPAGITILPTGNVLVATQNEVRQVTFPSATLDFGTVAVNSSTAGLQDFWNEGNYVLLRTGDPVITNPLFTNDVADTTCGGSVAAGTLCELAITFKPTTQGTKTGTATITDNGPTPVQTVQLTGTVVPAIIKSFTATAETESYGGPYTGSVTLEDNNGTVPHGNLTFTINGTVTCSLTNQDILGLVPCTLPNGTRLPVSGSPYTVAINFHDTNGNYPDQNTTTTLTESPRILTEIVNSKTKIYLQPNPILDGTPNGVLPGVGSDSFSVTYGYGATPITTTTPAGSYPGDITATVTPQGSTNTANYTIQVTPGDFTITKGALLGFGGAAVTESYGGAYAATAGFTIPPGGANPTGTITFTQNGRQLCPPIQSPATTVTCTSLNTGLPVGTYTVNINYSGDTNYSPAAATTTLTVTAVPLTVTVANQNKAFGAPVPSPLSTATVTGLTNGDTVGGTVQLTFNNAGSISASTPIGTYPNAITVTVAGSAARNYTITTVPGSFVVAGIATTTTLTSTAGTFAAGNSVTFTAQVSSSGNPTPAGIVTFTSDGVVIGTGTLDATGKVTFATAALAPGTHTVVASYGGNANYGSSSGSVTEVVTAPVGLLTISTTPNTQLIQGPGATVFMVTVASTGGFAGPVTLACSGLPVDATCAISTSSITLTAGGTATATVTTTTTNADAVVSANRVPANLGGSWRAVAITAAAALPMQLSGFGLLAAGIRRRRFSRGNRTLILLALSVGLLGLAGCGCPSTLYHTYPITITATSVNGGPAPVSSTVYLSVGQSQ